jgi:hypothetical protein
MKKLFTLFATMIAAVTMMAQVTTSSLSGTVINENDQFLQGATITAIDMSTHTPYHAVSDVNGVYRLQNLRPGGPYSLTINMMGYLSKTIDNIKLGLGENQTINIKMSVEDINLMEITVSAEAPAVNHNQGTTTNVDAEQISTLPTVSRSINDVLALSPQASSTSLGLAIGGGNFRQSYVTVDGAAFHNAYGIGSNLPAGGTPITLDALESVSISIAPFDVRQSGFIGGSVNAVTKSGTNQLHVSLYDYFTSDKLIGTRFGHKDDAGRYPDNLLLGQSLLNTVGFSVGGPIVKNKLFYFINFEYETDIAAGQMRYARQSETSDWGGNTQFNRPTVAKMDEIRQFLKDNYGYDPGEYQNYSFSTPDYKLMARLDWNINDNNRFNIRYSMVKHQFFTAPSNSITPLSSSLYNKNVYGRGSIYSLYFESSNYIQQQNFSSVAAELNSRFLYGRLTNTLRAVYSNQHEPRKMTRDLFPTVDILEPLDDGTKAVYTSFGPDPFTYGTGSTVNTFIVTDELGYSAGIHHIVGGLQFEFDKTTNRFMQGGAGYYVYNSWNDFVNQAAPAAFTIAYGNNEKHEQVATSFNFIQNSLYLQDELTLSDRFKMTAGLRVEIPYYPSIADNINNEFQNGWDNFTYAYDTTGTVIDSTLTHHAIADGDNSLSGLSTADMPKARVDFSPRLGFEWDLLGDNKLMLRGGSGIYTGRLPLVWIVTTVSNSNVAQGTYLTYNSPMSFYSSVDDIIANNSDKLKIGDLPASQIATILDKELRMPQTWKSSLALDAQLPGGINATLEGIYGKDLQSVAVTCLGMVQDDSIQLPGEPGKRAHWKSEGLVNSINGAITPFYITNSKENGFYYSVTGMLSKDFNCGLNLMAAYTYSCGKNVTDAIGDQVMSSYTNNTFGVHGSNSHEVGYSSYVSPNRVLLNAGWTWATGKHTTEMLSCYYEGYNLCYVGSYSYSRYSYTMTSNVNGDYGAHSLIYIPTHNELYAKDANGDFVMPFVSEDNRDAYESFIQDDKYLKSHRGQYAERGGAIAPWRHTVNLKYERTYKFHDGEALSFGVDVKNIGNLLHRGWGNVKQLSSGDILAWKNGKYQFNEPVWNDYADVISTWSAALNARFSF